MIHRILNKPKIWCKKLLFCWWFLSTFIIFQSHHQLQDALDFGLLKHVSLWLNFKVIISCRTSCSWWCNFQITYHELKVLGENKKNENEGNENENEDNENVVIFFKFEWSAISNCIPALPGSQHQSRGFKGKFF